MKLRDLFLTLAVVAIWGVNFVLIRVSLNEIPPLLLCSIRFLLVCFPWIFIVPRPKAPWKFIAGYGLCYFGFQFGLLFSAIQFGFPPGLSSLVLQTQVFFTMVLSYFIFSDRPSARKIIGAVIAFSGIALVGLRSSGDVTPFTLLMMLGAAFSFASGNMVSKAMVKTEPLSLIVWGSLVALPLLLFASLCFEGPAAMQLAFNHFTFRSFWSILYIVYLSTFLGFWLWSTLLNRYPPSTVAPFTLLVPVFGFLSSAFFLGEDLGGWKLVASLLVIFGLVLSQLSFKTLR